MRRPDAALPGRVLRVQHEDVVADLEGECAALGWTHCAWRSEPACLEFHKTEGASAPPAWNRSAGPIFRDGLDGWRSYEPWLACRRPAL